MTELTIKIGDLEFHDLEFHKVVIGTTRAGMSTTDTELLSLRPGALRLTESEQQTATAGGSGDGCEKP